MTLGILADGFYAALVASAGTRAAGFAEQVAFDGRMFDILEPATIAMELAEAPAGGELRNLIHQARGQTERKGRSETQNRFAAVLRGTSREQVPTSVPWFLARSHQWPQSAHFREIPPDILADIRTVVKGARRMDPPLLSGSPVEDVRAARARFMNAYAGWVAAEDREAAAEITAQAMEISAELAAEAAIIAAAEAAARGPSVVQAFQNTGVNVDVPEEFREAYASGKLYRPRGMGGIYTQRTELVLAASVILFHGLLSSLPAAKMDSPEEFFPMLMFELLPALPLSVSLLLNIQKIWIRHTLTRKAEEAAARQGRVPGHLEDIPADHTSYFCLVKTKHGSNELRISDSSEFRMLLPGEKLLAEGGIRRVDGRMVFCALDKRTDQSKVARLLAANVSPTAEVSYASPAGQYRGRRKLPLIGEG